MAAKQYRTSQANRQLQPLLSDICTPPPMDDHGPDTSKRLEVLGNEAEFIVRQAATPRLLQDSKFPSLPPRRPRRGSSSQFGFFNKVFTQSPPPSPMFETTFVTVLLLPQNGSRPVLLTIRTTDIRLESHKDNHLSHIPDMRSFWGDGDAWHSRIQQYSSLAMVKDSADDLLTGTYMLLYTPEGNGLPRNKRWQEGVSGHACIVKMGRNMWGKGGVAAYDDVKQEFLDSGLYKKMLTGLFTTPVTTMQLSARPVEESKDKQF